MSEVLKTEQLNKIREIVRKMVRERMIDEMNTTDSVEGYNTPFAFSGKDSEKKKAKRQADLTGYTVVSEKKYSSFADPLEGFPTEYKELLKKLQRSNDSDERTELIDKMNVIRKNIKLKPLTNELINENRWLALKQDESTGYSVVNETHTSFVSGNSGRTITHLDNKKYQLTKDVKGAQIGNYNNVVLPKGSVIHNLPGGVFVQHSSLKDKFTGIKEVPKLGMRVTTKPDTLISIEKSSKILEIVNENRWLALKQDESTAQAKIGRGISNINKQLREMERFLNWYGKIKNESGVSNKSYWKRTNSHIYSIQERLLKLDQKIRQISE